MVRTIAVCLSFVIFSTPALRAQDDAPVPALLKGLKPRNVGPANMSGRVTDVAVYEAEPRIMYVASAAGGLWKTVNLGTTWKPVFERESTIALGAVAVFRKDPNIVWVGTGEANPRNSVSWGDGVYRSTDGGKSWKHVGLRPTQHIGRIVLHPENPQIAYVAALGKLWAPSPERGVYKTTDGGASWTKVLYFDDNTGAVDLAMDPIDPQILYTCLYQVRRGPFSGGNPAVQTGPRAGLYKTTDGGANWQRLTEGLPRRPFGRCGITIHRKNPNILYAVVQSDKTAVSVTGQAPNLKLDYDAGGIYRSDDKGKTWKHLNSLCPRPFYYGQIRVDPLDDQRIYVLGVAFFVSTTGGAKFNTTNAARGTHVDYHAMWINPRDPHHLVLGCDGGLNLSFDRGDTWEHLKNLPVSQFYAVTYDLGTPYRIYGGLQDNGTWGAATRTRDSEGITLAEWNNFLGFDGYYTQVPPDDLDTLYCEGQYGILRRINVKTGALTDIKPRLDSKTAKTNIATAVPRNHPGFRFNWSSPIVLSPHESRTLYFGGNHVFRSQDRGDTWLIVSPDLTYGKPGPSDYNGHTISTLVESPRKKGLLYAGTDDGRFFVTQDGGGAWEELSGTIADVRPQRWIARLEASPHDDATVFLAIDRHRNDDHSPYLYVSRDFGKSWESLVSNLPKEGPVYVIRQDARRPDLLYAGTEFGLFVSLNAGRSWHKQQHLPTVPVHDVAVHPRERELIIATHGRGIYIQDAAVLQDWTAEARTKGAWLFDVPAAEAYRERPFHRLGIKAYTGDNPPRGAAMHVFLDKVPKELPVVTIQDAKGKKLADLKGVSEAGLQRVLWNLMRPNTVQGNYNPVAPGTYTAVLRAAGQELRKDFTVKVEP